MDRLLIVGAGLCGSSLARSLTEKKSPAFSISLLEKSRGVGGRMAHRRIGENEGPATTPDGPHAHHPTSGHAFNHAFNHGCENIPLGLKNLWPREWPADWTNWIDGENKIKAPATDICKALLKDLVVHRNVQAHNLKLESTHSLHDQESKRWDFEQLIVTVPVPQALQLLSVFLTDKEKALLASVICEKVLICFYRDADGENQMLKALPEWSDIHFEASTDEIKKAFQREFLPEIPLESFLEIKKWRFSQTHHPLAQNYLRLEKYPWMWIAGDGFAAAAGEGVLRALQSGLATAAAFAAAL